jgi:hypothetical protein
MQDLPEKFTTLGYDDEFTYHYLDALRANLINAEKSISRQLLLITVISAFFLVLARNQVSNVTFSIITLKNYYFVQASIPVVIAVSYLSTVNTMQMAIELIGVHDQLVEGLRPAVRQDHHERLLWPASGAFAALAALPALMRSERIGKVTLYGSWVRYTIYLATPVVMVGYGIWFLLTNHPSPLQWTASVVSAIIIIFSLPLSYSIGRAVVRLASG